MWTVVLHLIHVFVVINSNFRSSKLGFNFNVFNSSSFTSIRSWSGSCSCSCSYSLATQWLQKKRKVSDNYILAITFKCSNIIIVVMIVTMNLFWTAREYSNFTLNRYVFTVGKSEAKHLWINQFRWFNCEPF